jgi:anti-sigma-K factor RskA
MPLDLRCDDVRDLAAGFVLDALKPEEMDAVRAHLVDCDDAHAEMAELAGALPILAASVPVVEPSAGLKDRIMAAAAADLAATEAAKPPEPIPFPTAPAAPDPAPSRWSSGSRLMRVAAVVAIVLMGAWNIFLLGELQASRTYELAVAAVLDAAAEPGASTAVLTPESGVGPTGLAAVSVSGDVTLAMRELAPTDGSEVYEAWVIGGDGTPVPIGSFPVGSAGTAFLEVEGTPAGDGAVLALTLEPAPGATTPTMPIVSLGTATEG